MALLDRLLGRTVVQSAASAGLDVYQPARLNLGDPFESFDGHYYGSSGIAIADPGVPLTALRKGDVEAVWQSQPDVRKVVDFIAGNIASVPLRLYDRVSDDDRERVRDHPLARTLSRPQRRTGAYRFWRAVLSDGLLYDKWAVLALDAGDGTELIHIPSWRLRLDVNALRIVVGAAMWVGDMPAEPGDKDGYRPLDFERLIFDHGYAPKTAGLSPIETLRDTLAERAAAVQWRQQVWANGARASAYLASPQGTEFPNKETKSRFLAQFNALWVGRNAEKPGGVPMLENGIELRSVDVTDSSDALDLEGRKLAAEEICTLFHIAPEALHIREGTYSNIKEIRQSLYRDSLGPYITSLEQTLNAQLLPLFDDGGRDLYIEANLDVKLRGSFEERASILQAAVGGPTHTLNEARAKENLPAVEGGDVVARPMNLLYGSSTATPGDTDDAPAGTSGAPATSSAQPARKAARTLVKARPTQSVVDEATATLEAFFDRQGAAVASAGGDWDDDRWNDELADELTAVNVLVATATGRKTLDALGFDPAEWDEGRTLGWLRANAEGVAVGVNDATKTQVRDAIDADPGRAPGRAAASVFSGAVKQRVGALAESQVSSISGFGTTEAVQQMGLTATKTWRVRSQRPRASHARLDGTTVDMGEKFSNGMRWPGDSQGDPDERAGCTCDIDVSVR